MTLVLGARCRDGVILAADRRRLARYEKGPDTAKLHKLRSGLVLAGAGDDAVLNEARILIDRRLAESAASYPEMRLFDVVEITSAVVNELVGLYQQKVEEPFGFVLAGLENMTSGNAKLYTVFGAGLSDVPWICLGSGSSYARPLVDLLLARGDLTCDKASRIMPTLFTLVSSVHTAIGGGVDICAMKDNNAAGLIDHSTEVSLEGLRTAILERILD